MSEPPPPQALIPRPHSAGIAAGADRDRLLERFLENQTENTRRAYCRDLEDFTGRLGTSGARQAAERLCASPTPGPVNQLVHDYVSHLRQRGLAPATINRRLAAALRSLVRLARSFDLVTWALDVPGERVRSYRDTREPDVAGARRLAGGLQREDAKGARDRAILRLLWDLGLRRSEVAELDLEHIDLQASTIQVREKGEHDRIPLPLPDETRAALQAWLDVRGLEPGPLFVSLDNAASARTPEPQRLSTTSIYRELRKIGDRVQIKVRPDGVRHGAITTVLDLNGGDVRAAQRFSRQKDVRTLLVDDKRQDLGGKMARLVASAA